MPNFPDHAQLANVALIEDLYARYLVNPDGVDPSWRHFFEGIDFGKALYLRAPTSSSSADIVNTYRRFGHLQAQFNPLGPNSQPVFELNFLNPDPATLTMLKKTYCDKIGYEYMDLGRSELEKWMQQRLEKEPGQVDFDDYTILEYLTKAEGFESFLHTKYVGQTRFSLEGAETLIPMMAELINRGATLGVDEVFIGMAHRGRLNVLANILGKSYSTLFDEFEDDTSLSFPGNDDVKYHMGFVSSFETKEKKRVTLHLAANPSHLESVDPVVLGQTKACQLKKQDKDQVKTVPILIHGDASVAGQGVVYETMQLMNLPSYSVGGTIHIVINNQIGYTTTADEGRSTRYATDIAKAFGVPVFHVNAEDPRECAKVAVLAIDIRQTFHIDVFIDLVCYRKYGHNEGDEPGYTQPLQYKLIRSKKTIRQMYLDSLILEAKLDANQLKLIEGQFKESLKSMIVQSQPKSPSAVKELNVFEQMATEVDIPTIKKVLEQFCTIVQGFHLHPKLQTWLKNRLKETVDWATAEALAFGTLILQNVSIRLAGQDSQRGTFSQRHIVWTDCETGEKYFPLKMDVINSPLTEYAGMGFEYGYTWGNPEAFVLWEAQYGDFDNGAQIIIDQYIACGEHKWNTPSSLTLLLPHAYEGAGPEHSSARLERFLQLGALQNIQVVNCTTPAQYFHLLRRQALRKVKKPLIVFTPKSLLRSAFCVSSLEQLSEGSFVEILDDSIGPNEIKRVIFCSGKIYYDLLAARTRNDVALVRIEQLYPLHCDLLNKILTKYKGKELYWVQEEPQNMGAWSYIQPFLKEAHYVGREASATTATGSSRKHKQEQQLLIEKAFA